MCGNQKLLLKLCRGAWEEDGSVIPLSMSFRYINNHPDQDPCEWQVTPKEEPEERRTQPRRETFV